MELPDWTDDAIRRRMETARQRLAFAERPEETQEDEDPEGDEAAGQTDQETDAEDAPTSNGDWQDPGIDTPALSATKRRTAGSESMTSLSGDIAAMMKPTELPEKPCPACGEKMTAGRIILGRPVYEHLILCPAARERDLRLQAQKLVADLRGLAAAAANLPADPHGIGDLAGYVERFGAPATSREGVDICVDFLAACGKRRLPKSGFTLFGIVGAGKTTLVAALARSLIDRGVRLRWETTPDLYNRLLGLLRANRLDGALEQMTAAQVLVLDDLGREKPSPWWVDQVLFPVIDERYRNGRPIVATTNYSWPHLQRRLSSATNERGEVSESGPFIRDRLEEFAAMIPFGPAGSLRRARWDFRSGGRE